MRRLAVLLSTVALVLAASPIVTAPAIAGSPPNEALFGDWHRLSPDGDDGVHQVWSFHRENTQWAGLLRQQPDATRRDAGVVGKFVGQELELGNFDWWGIGPRDWIGQSAFAVEGWTTFGTLPGEDVLEVWTVGLVTDSDVLWWGLTFEGRDENGDLFEIVTVGCPSYRDFDAALAANPSGTFDCFVALDFDLDGEADFVFCGFDDLGNPAECLD